METVSNIAASASAAASRAIWGASENDVDGKTTQNNESHGEEPVAGQKGNVAKGEPYDAGNIGMSPLVPLHHPIRSSTVRDAAGAQIREELTDKVQNPP